MPVDSPNTIDIIGFNNQRAVVLTISDHLEWDTSLEHQLILQTKLNTYLRFIESGELFEQYPTARTSSFYTEIVFKYEPDHEGYLFLERAKAVFVEAGFLLRHEIFGASKI